MGRITGAGRRALGQPGSRPLATALVRLGGRSDRAHACGTSVGNDMTFHKS